MTDITDALAVANAAKVEHFQEVADLMEAVRAKIDSKPDLWFGGQPPIFNEISTSISHQKHRLLLVAGLVSEDA